jgi:hypothetical protein
MGRRIPCKWSANSVEKEEYVVKWSKFHKMFVINRIT